MSAVLVTGGTGFVGAWVTRRLVEQGVKVVAYSRHPDTTFIKDIADRVNCVAGDIMDLPRLIDTIRQYGVDRVIHTAASLTHHLEANPFLGYRVDVDGTMNIFEACRLADVKRVVYVSSRAVYDIPRGEYAHPTYQPISEDYPKAPRTIYGGIKIFMETMGLNYNSIYGLDFAVVRFAQTYGPGKQARHAVLVTNKIIESAIIGKPLTVSTDVDLKNDMIYVKDIANGIVLACFAKNLKHRIFHLGTGKGETIRHVIDIVNSISGGSLIEVKSAGVSDNYASQNYVFNIDRARRELGYSPQYNLEKSIPDYIETMKQLNIKPVILD